MVDLRMRLRDFSLLKALAVKTGSGEFDIRWWFSLTKIGNVFVKSAPRLFLHV